VNNILSILTPYQGNKQIVKYNQSVGDIMAGILRTHEQYKNDYDKICLSFWKGNVSKTAKAIYNFLAANTHYKVEPDDKQTLRSPAAILYLGGQKNTGLDCKSYALFTGGILDALKRKGKKINFCYRFASYKMFDKLPHHVFVVINPDQYNEIWVDNVLPSFNEKKYPSYKIDKFTPMAIIAVSGIGRTRRTKAERKQRLKDKIRKSGKFLLKFNPATASSRNSFLLLVKVNFFGLAHKLLAVYKANPNKLKHFWESIGGNYKSLAKNIAEGIKHGKHKKEDTMNGIGVLPAIAAAIAAATPIVLKAIQLMKSVGINPDKLIDAGKKMISVAVNKQIDEQADKQESADDSSDSDSNEAADNSNDSNSNDSNENINGIVSWPPTPSYSKQKYNLGSFA
jgi:hypothetical protein